MRTQIRELIETTILTLTIFAVLQFSLQNYLVQGPSMIPTLNEGERLFVNKLIYKRIPSIELSKTFPFINKSESKYVYFFNPPEKGEIVVFKSPNIPNIKIVKRAIGLPGDEISINNGTVIVNNSPLNERYVSNLGKSNIPRFIVPPNHLFVLGDNRLQSDDSRSWGLLNSKNIIGRVFIIYWPLNNFKLF
ncbi:MAG: signal peptidase I [Chloroflexi bacterium]|nr:signal peptidase I [Chloroflexota bacterium]|tara:strand:- start:206 stop:778 length:573 start_codon:yes stop_codon:yes gene_type:complete